MRVKDALTEPGGGEERLLSVLNTPGWMYEG